METIFIVDDDEQMLKACQRLLRKESYHCRTFVSPEKAMEEAVIIKPSVVVSDQRMPDLEGTVFLERIKEKLPYTVRIIMTGYADIDVVINAINKGQVYRFIKKPFDDVLFKAEIRHAVEYYAFVKKQQSILAKSITKSLDKPERFQGVLEMAGAVCHEFSQPLQVISGYCGLLEDISESNPDIQARTKFVSHIKREADKLGKLLLKIMTINEYKTKPYMDGSQVIDIYGSSIDESVYRMFDKENP